MALKPWRRFITFANNTADRILGLAQHKIAKVLVLTWLVLSSILTPVYTWHNARQQAAREGLTELPRVLVLIDEAGWCHAANRSARALVHVELRRFLHSFDPHVGCIPEEGALPTIMTPVAKTATLSAGDSLAELHTTPSLRETLSRAPPCNGATPCFRLLECELVFHRSADLRRFDRVAFAGVTQDSQIEFPISNISSRPPRWGGGATYTRSVKDDWKRPFECAQDQRRTRHSMDELREQLLDGTDHVMQSK
jgi:hypothetical protein